MKIEFLFYQIKQLENLYEYKSIEDDTWGEGQEEVYHGEEYCNNIINRMQNAIPLINGIRYCGSGERIANEVFEMQANGKMYSISFTIDSYASESSHKGKIRILVRIITEDSTTYDDILESIKIYLKNCMLPDWNTCIWITDEQSQALSAQLYPDVFNAENKIRAFANKVLVTKFGVNWNNQIGLEKYFNAYRKAFPSFRRISRNFSDIDDFFISMTLEMLFEIILTAKVFNTSINLDEALCLKIHEKISEQNTNSIFEKVKDARTVKIDLWNDVFSQYLQDHDNTKNLITNFILNRNHIAHNKLIDKATFQIMQQNFDAIANTFDQASEKYEIDNPSDELYLTWEVEQDAQEQEAEDREWYEHGYYLSRIEAETGIVIHDRSGIFDSYIEMLEEMHSDIGNESHFDYAVSVRPAIKSQEMKLRKLLGIDLTRTKDDSPLDERRRP